MFGFVYLQFIKYKKETVLVCLAGKTKVVVQGSGFRVIGRFDQVDLTGVDSPNVKAFRDDHTYTHV